MTRIENRSEGEVKLQGELSQGSGSLARTPEATAFDRSSPAQRPVRARCARTGGKAPNRRDACHGPPTALRGSSGYETSRYPGRGTRGAARPARTAAVDAP